MGGIPNPEDAPLKQEMVGCWGRRPRGMRHARLATVATSRVVSVGVLFVLRLSLLLLLVFGGVWVTWRSSPDDRFDEEPPPLLCLPDWSYAVTLLYFMMGALACLRQTNVRPFTPRSSVSVTGGESVRRSLMSTATLFLLEVSVVFQTLAMPVTWIEHARSGQQDGHALVSTLALAAVLLDLLLNRARVEAKHTWCMLAFLLAWLVEQVAWVHSDASHKACFEEFDAKGVHSLATALVAAIVVVAVVFAYAALCAQRDRVTSQFGSSLDVDYSGPDLEEDTGQEAVVPGTISVASMNLRAPPASERASVVNPIFAGSGSRMNRPWPTKNKGGEHRNSLTSTETEMSSGEDLEQAWPPEGEPPAASGGGRDATRSSPAVQDGAGRRADGGKAGAALTAHPSSWAGYGGASAWVRSSSRDVTPSARGAKVGARRGPSRF